MIQIFTLGAVAGFLSYFAIVTALYAVEMRHAWKIRHSSIREDRIASTKNRIHFALQTYKMYMECPQWYGDFDKINTWSNHLGLK